jgi:hypothetical protein
MIPFGRDPIYGIGPAVYHFSPGHSMAQRNILLLLEGGDRRSIGHADRVVAIVFKSPILFRSLVSGLWSENPLVRMRAADAIEKLTRTNPAMLQPYKQELLGLMKDAEQQELRWHLAVMVPRLSLTASERQLVTSLLSDYLQDRSSLVKTFALQGLADLAQLDPDIRAAAIEILRKATRNGTPAMKARSRKLLSRLEPD